MLDWIRSIDLPAVLLLVSVLGLGAALLWALFDAALRDRRLEKSDPPSPEELEDIQALRRTGGFRLGGRKSAAARHFEADRLHGGGGNREGSRGTYEPYLDKSWRDERSEG